MRWNQLQSASSHLGRGLEEAPDVLDFSMQMEQAKAWIADNELMIQRCDVGRDYEHCQVMKRCN